MPERDVGGKLSPGRISQESIQGRAELFKDLDMTEEHANEFDDYLQHHTQSHGDWNGLPMMVKLDSLHTLTEWLFVNPTRIRTLMKADDDGALTWVSFDHSASGLVNLLQRVEPIGYDAKRNAYWHIGSMYPISSPHRNKLLSNDNRSIMDSARSPSTS